MGGQRAESKDGSYFQIRMWNTNFFLPVPGIQTDLQTPSRRHTGEASHEDFTMGSSTTLTSLSASRRFSLCMFHNCSSLGGWGGVKCV